MSPSPDMSLSCGFGARSAAPLHVRGATAIAAAARLRAVLLVGMGLLAVLTSLPGAAQGIDVPKRRPTFTPGELALLPPYCGSVQGMAGWIGPEGDRWRAILGEDFVHFHHYCRGLRDVNFARVAATAAPVRRFLWNRSINEFEYMIRNSKPTMALMPEIFLKMGESYVELGRLGEAYAAFENSRRLKPDYWPAYTRWIDELLKLKQTDAARTLIQEALHQLPDHPELCARLRKLGPASSGCRAP